MAFPAWKDRLPEQEALKVQAEGTIVSDGTHVKDCYWRGYQYNGKHYVGLNDGADIWETDEATMREHCVEG